MCCADHNIELAKRTRFWVILIVFLLLAGVFTIIGITFITINQEKLINEEESYKSINVTVDAYESLNILCYPNSINPTSRNPISRILKSPTPTPYTGVIIVLYKVNNYTYYDEKRVTCGNTYQDAINNAKHKYPKDIPILMYYQSDDPDAGVVFKPTYSNSFSFEIMTCFLMVPICLGVAMLAFIPPRKPKPVLIVYHNDIDIDNS